MFLTCPDSWKDVLSEEWRKPYFATLSHFVEQSYAHETVYPPATHIFRALEETPFDAVKVVLLGQDPYHAPGEAFGLAFAVPAGNPVPPSLRNIARELVSEYPSLQEKGAPPYRPDLARWARQGVLLINATLTVARGRAGSHRGRGWETFTDALIRAVSAKRPACVFLLWGKDAQRKAALVDASRHLVLKAAHPSPLSAYHGFFGCGHFQKANAYLAAHRLTPIAW